MAVEDASKPEPSPGASAQTRGSVPMAPGWLVPAYLGGLVLVYLGQRVIVTQEQLRDVATLLGLALVAISTIMRFMPQQRAAKQASSVERVFGLLSLSGALGLALYFASTPAGLALLGIDALDAEAKDRAETLLQVAWVLLVFCSAIPMLFAEFAMRPMRSAEQIESRRVSAAAASGLSLALACGYCALLVYSAGEAGVQADYSYFKTSEPSSSTRRMVESFEEPLTITGFFPDVSDVRGEVSAYLHSLSEGVANVELKLVDRYLEPKLAEELKVFSDGTIVFQKGESKRTLTVGSEMKTARSKLKTLDRDVQEQLYKLLRSRRVAYLTVGHGELNAPSPEDQRKGRAAEGFQTILRKQNYQVRSLGLAQGLGRDVPEDAALVVVLGPTQPFAQEELDSLRRYAEGGGDLFLALDPDSEFSLPSVATPDTAQAAAGEGSQEPPEEGSALVESLNALAQLAGLQLSGDLLANETHHVRRRANDSDRALLVSNRFSSHASVSTLSRNASRAAILMARSGSLSAAGGPEFQVDMALKAMGGTFADKDQDYTFDTGSEKKDTYNLVAAVTRKLPGASAHAAVATKEGEDKPKVEAKAFVLADADALSDLILTNFQPNQFLLVDAIRWLGGEESFVGEVSDEQDVRIEHTKQKDLAWFYATIFGAPLLVLGLGLVVAKRARRTGQSKVVTA